MGFYSSETLKSLKPKTADGLKKRSEKSVL